MTDKKPTKYENFQTLVIAVFIIGIILYYIVPTEMREAVLSVDAWWEDGEVGALPIGLIAGVVLVIIAIIIISIGSSVDEWFRKK